MRIGLLGGSFDPPHHGHLLAAGDAFEALGLDRLVLIPASAQPYDNGGYGPGYDQDPNYNYDQGYDPNYAPGYDQNYAQGYGDYGYSFEYGGRRRARDRAPEPALSTERF